MYLPKDILISIYSYDPTFKESYDKCINDIKKFYNKHRIITITYNDVNINDKRFFKRYNKYFYKYILLNI